MHCRKGEGVSCNSHAFAGPIKPDLPRQFDAHSVIFIDDQDEIYKYVVQQTVIRIAQKRWKVLLKHDCHRVISRAVAESNVIGIVEVNNRLSTLQLHFVYPVKIDLFCLVQRLTPMSEVKEDGFD